MDKETATKTLTEELVKHNGRLVINDDEYKEELIEGARHVYVAGDTAETVFKAEDYCKDKPWRNLTKSGRSKTLVNALETSLPANANYLFYSVLPVQVCSSTQVHATPYSIIGEREIDSIKHLFYKNSDTRIREAISTLEIEDHFKLYNTYINSNLNFLEALLAKKEVLDFFDSLQYRTDDYTDLKVFGPEKINSLNSKLEILDVNHIFDCDSSSGNWWVTRQIVRGLTKKVEENGGLKDYSNFFNFVFELPYEDQNIEVNKLIIQECNKYLNTNLILLREYKGQHFKEYFELLNETQQREIFDIVKNTSPQNADYNAFLWEKGFKDIKLDYLSLYREDSNSFIEYFNGRGKEGKKAILEEILKCEHMNSEVIDWLDEHEPELIKEAGLSKN